MRQSKYSLKKKKKEKQFRNTRNTLKGEKDNQLNKPRNAAVTQWSAVIFNVSRGFKAPVQLSGQDSAAFCPTCIIRRPLTFTCLCLQAQMDSSE